MLPLPVRIILIVVASGLILVNTLSFLTHSRLLAAWTATWLPFDPALVPPYIHRIWLLPLVLIAGIWLKPLPAKKRVPGQLSED